MSTDSSGNLNTTDKKFPSDHTRQIIYSIRRLIQASELYTKELNKKYQVSAFAERMRNSPDRRVITIQLTEAGKKLAQNAPPPIQQKVVDALKQTENAKKEQIVRSLNMLTGMLDIQDLEVK